MIIATSIILVLLIFSKFLISWPQILEKISYYLLIAFSAEPILLLMGLLLNPNACNPISTTRGLTAFIMLIYFTAIPILIIASLGFRHQIEMLKELLGMHDNNMLPNAV